ncbi:MAG: peptidylprolyl isomerase [Blastopirellula sp.]|nr:peptidylprolyl isomerase [Blastopirellula sp.]
MCTRFGNLTLGLFVTFSALTASVALQAAEEEAKPVTVEMKTNLGTIEIELNTAKAPKTVKNFLQYAKSKHYDGTIFHRVIDGFMIQGGGFAKKPEGIEEKATAAPVENEAKNGLKNQRGTIAMARTSAPHSATSQFFINVKDNANLDFPSFDGWGYAVFGRVTKGMDVVDKIKATKTGRRTLKSRVGENLFPSNMSDVPVEDVVIESVRVK